MIVKIERWEREFRVEVGGLKFGSYVDVYIDGESAKANDWQVAIVDAIAVYVSDDGDTLIINTLAGALHNAIHSIVEVVKK